MLKEYTYYSKTAHCFINRNTLALGFGNSLIPSNITVIGNGAFNGCSNLHSIKIPYGITSIGDLCFWQCVNLTQVFIPDSLTSMGNLCFWGCANLKYIYIPDNLKHMGENVFDGCNRLVISCQAIKKPSTWKAAWNPLGCKVQWGESRGD